MVYHWWISIDYICRFRTQLPTVFRRMLTWLLPKDGFTCPTHISEVSLKFSTCLIVVLKINLEVQVWICSDWNYWSYSPDLLLWHTKNGNETRSLIDNINLTFIALTATAIHHYLLPWKTGEFMIPSEFGPEGGAQHKCDTRDSNHNIHTARTDVFRRLHTNFGSSSPAVQGRKIGNIHSIIRQRIHSTRTVLAMAQPHNDQGSFDEDFLDYVPEELVDQPDNSFSHLSMFVTATESSMWVSAVLPMGGSAIACSSQPIPCSGPNSNSNHITNMTSIESMGLVDGGTIVEGAMLLWG